MKSIPNVFISATTSDLKEARRHVADLVLQSGGYPIVEEGFEAEANNVSAKRTINLKLRAADVVIHIAGLHYGGEPAFLPAGQPRQSWTQMEYNEAQKLGKRVLVCLADLKFYRGKLPAEIGTKKDQREKVRLQKQHYESLIKGDGWHYKFTKIGDLTQPVANFLKSLNVKKAKTVASARILYIGAQKGTGGTKYLDFDLRGQLKALKKAIGSHASGKAISVFSLFDGTPLEILAKINQVRPDILHISGAQEAGCIKLHDSKGSLVSFDAENLADLISDSNDGTLRLVVLDTCYSMQQAKRLTSSGVPYAIGIYDSIADEVSTEFYSCFYNSIASGKDLQVSVNTATKLILGHAKADRRWLGKLEDVLEMKFNATVHLPKISAAAGLSASQEHFP
jgi:hypothetical protein